MKFVSVTVCCIAMGFLQQACAQSYPVKPVRLVMAVSGGAEVVVRVASQRWQEVTGQPMVMEVQSGAGGAVGAERRQLLLVSSEQLEQMSAQSYTKLRAEAQQKGVLNTDAALTQRVRAIASRIEPQTRVFRADAPGWKWEVNVISSNELNAFCMPGGKIAVYTGLLPITRTGTGLAVVISHEVAHALARHGAERMSDQMVASVGVAAASAALATTASGMASRTGMSPRSQPATIGTSISCVARYARAQSSIGGVRRTPPAIGASRPGRRAPSSRERARCSNNRNGPAPDPKSPPAARPTR